MMERSAGIFLHPTSLPSMFGIGDLGETARQWISFVKDCGCTCWQVCPLGPTGYGDSPYQCLSSFAGNVLLLSPEVLAREGLVTKEEIDAYPRLRDDRVDFGGVIAAKDALFREACLRFQETADFLDFCEREAFWLEDYALFRVIKDKHDGKMWHEWEPQYRLRYPAALNEVRSAARREIKYHKFLQYQFNKQWTNLKTEAQALGIRIIGDIPYYVAYDSADAWSSPDLFEFDEGGCPVFVAGVPPDYFSATGQLWGNPIYRWDYMKTDGYAWWIGRIRKTLELVDYIRLDHFRGFDSYWAIPANQDTAVNGTWVKGPGIDFFNAIREELGQLPIIAEDLGEITAGVEELRRQTGLPGMKVLQFAFDGNRANPYLPYNITPDSIIYTGTHDNDTSLGWFISLPVDRKHQVCDYLGVKEEEFIEGFVREAYAAPSRLCIIPMQDVLGLDSHHRMNTPGRSQGNWQWRFTPSMLNDGAKRMLHSYAELYGRLPETK